MSLMNSSSGGIKIQSKKTGLAAALEAEEAAKNALMVNKKDELKNKDVYIPAHEASEKIRIIFDDSGSMGFGPTSKIADAREGCIEFMRNCGLNQTAVAIHLMSGGETMYNDIRPSDMTSLTANLPALSVLVGGINSSGSTPMFETALRAMELEPKATRYIFFSDGQPNSTVNEERVINSARELKTPIDTVLIAERDEETMKFSSEYLLMKRVAEKTNGIFLFFDRNKVNFSKAFKYLAPTQRFRLADKSFKAALEAGGIK